MSNRLEEYRKTSVKVQTLDLISGVGPMAASFMSVFVYKFIFGDLVGLEGWALAASGTLAAITTGVLFHLAIRPRLKRWSKIEELQREEVHKAYGIPSEVRLDPPSRDGERGVANVAKGNRTEAYTFIREDGVIRVYDPEGNELVDKGATEAPTRVSPEPVVYAENEQLWQTAASGK